MKHLLRFLILALAIFTIMPTGAMAADLGGIGSFGFHPYMGVGLGVYDLDFSASGFSQSNNVFGGMVKFGADFNNYLGVEVRAATTDQTFQTYYSIGNVSYGFWQKADYLLSYLVKLQYPVTQEFKVYSLVGGTSGKVSFMGAQEYAGNYATGFSYGAGFDYSVDDFMDVGLEYMRYWNGVSVNPSNSFPASEKISSYLATIKIAM